MPIRTTPSAVSEIIETDVDISLTPFIETASALVDEICVPLGYDDARLELIERWLSAHFYAVRDMRLSGEGVGPIQANYQYRVDLRLQVTIYGQQALILDTKGGLKTLNKDKVGGFKFFWAGVDKRDYRK